MNLLDGIKEKNVIKTELTTSITIGNVTEVYPIYKIRLDKLYYNDQNDRIATWISQYKYDNGIDKFNTDNREEYNSIIHKFVTDSNQQALKKTQNNIELLGQQRPGVVLIDGRIVDGNRRFTCLRNIQEKTTKLQYFNAVILDRDIVSNAKEIKMLELYLQHGIDKPIDYNPIDRLVGIYNDIVDKKILTVTEYANSINSTEKEVQMEVEKAKLMVEFLEFINADKQFYLARKLNINDPLKELVMITRKIYDEDEREDLKNIFFANLLLKPEGDATRYLRKIKKIANDSTHLNEYVNEQMELTARVCDIIGKYDQISEDIINNNIMNQEELKNEFDRSTEKWVARSDSKTSRKMPLQLLCKAYDHLDSIDTNIFKKLSDDEKEKLICKLESIQDMIDEIRSDIDV